MNSKKSQKQESMIQIDDEQLMLENELEDLVRELSQPEHFQSEQASFKWFAAVIRSNLPSMVLLDMSVAIVSGSKAKVKDRPLCKMERESRSKR